MLLNLYVFVKLIPLLEGLCLCERKWIVSDCEDGTELTEETAEDSLFELSLKWNSWPRPLDSTERQRHAED